jgi:hypothetical protein
MTIEGALLAKLTGAAGLAALVAARVYALEAPQNTALPLVTFQRVSAERFHNWGADAGVKGEVWQFDAWGRTYDEACDVAEQIEAALSRFSGTADSTVIQDVLFDSDTDLRDESATPTGTTDTGGWRRMLEAQVFYEG